MVLMADHCSLSISYSYLHFLFYYFSSAGEDFIASFARHGTKPYFITEGVSYIIFFNIAVNWPITNSFTLYTTDHSEYIFPAFI